MIVYFDSSAGKLQIAPVAYPSHTAIAEGEGVSMAFGERIRRLRQQQQWTQAELGEKLGVHQKQVSAYERDINVPSTEILIKLASVFDVTLDYLAFEAEGQPATVSIQDRELLRRFESVDKLPERDKALAKEILDLVLLKHRFKQLVDTDAA